MMSNSYNNLIKPDTKEQLEQFDAQIMVQFDNEIHLLIQHLLPPMQPLNEGLNGAPNRAINRSLNDDSIIKEKQHEQPPNAFAGAQT